MKGIVKGKTIFLEDELPKHISDGETVDVVITPVKTRKYPFPTFNLALKEEYLQREKMYEKG